MPKNSPAAPNGTTGTIHLTLQGKGGVGKSLIAAVLAQYLRQTGPDVRCIDTDPVNRTFAQYGALKADRLCLRDEHNRIDQRSFDALMERFLSEDAQPAEVRKRLEPGEMCACGKERGCAPGCLGLHRRASRKK